MCDEIGGCDVSDKFVDVNGFYWSVRKVDKRRRREG